MRYPIRFYLEADVEVEADSEEAAIEAAKEMTPGEILVNAIAPVSWHECLVGEESDD